MSKKRHGYWTKENCHKEALKYSTKTEFRNSSGGAYRKILKEKWDTDEFFKHMNRPIGRGIKWTKEKCHEEALKYKHKVDFKKYGKGARWAASINGWYDEITSHMVPLGNKQNRYIYKFVFSDGVEYVGITYHIQKRETQHLTQNKSPIYKYMLKNKGISYKLIILGYYSEFEALDKEKKIIQNLKDSGVELLNKSNGGEGGAISLKWTKERCHEEALKYKHKVDFKNAYGSAYSRAIVCGWLDEITSHMTTKVNKQKV